MEGRYGEKGTDFIARLVFTRLDVQTSLRSGTGTPGFYNAFYYGGVAVWTTDGFIVTLSSCLYRGAML